MNPERSKNYYEILAIDRLCSPEDIKHAFRTQIALSHPDKVSHLAQEIQELAFQRTAELTEAYRVLSNGELRSHYDRKLQGTMKPAAPINGNESVRKFEESAGGLGKDDFLYKTGLARVRSAVQETVPGMCESPVRGFDLAFAARRKWGILSTGRDCAQVLVRALPLVDSQAVEEGWAGALKVARGIKGDLYLFLMGVKLGGADRLSASILALQRQTRLQDETRILVIPLNVNSFAALIPNGAPEPLRGIIRALQNPR